MIEKIVGYLLRRMIWKECPNHFTCEECKYNTPCQDCALIRLRVILEGDDEIRED